MNLQYPKIFGIIYIESKRKEVMLNERNSSRKGWIAIYINEFRVSTHDVAWIMNDYGRSIVERQFISSRLAELFDSLSESATYLTFTPSVTNDSINCYGHPNIILFDIKASVYGKEELITREAFVSVEFITLLSAYSGEGWVFKHDKFKELCRSYFQDAYKHAVPYIERDDYHALVEWLNDSHETTCIAEFLGNDSALVLSDGKEFVYIEVPRDFVECLWEVGGESYYTPDFRKAFFLKGEQDSVGNMVSNFQPVCTCYTSEDPPEDPNDSDIWQKPTGETYVFHGGKPYLISVGETVNFEPDRFNVDSNFVEQVSKKLDKILTSKEKENDTMMKLPTTNFDFGPVTNGRVALSPYGLAIMQGDHWYAFNAATRQTIDVTGFTFDMKGMIYKMPVAANAVAPGDMILHNGNPMYVVATGGTKLTAVDLVQSEEKTVIPVTNIFNFNFVTKVVSLVNLGFMQPTADQPFGNLMPMMMLSSLLGEDNKGNVFGGDNDLVKLMMVSSMMGNNSQNPFGQLFSFGVNPAPAGGDPNEQ